MMKKIKFLFCAFVLSTTWVYSMSFKNWEERNKETIWSTKYPSQFEYNKEFMGFDHIWMTIHEPVYGRSSLSLTITNSNPDAFDPALLKNTQNDYHEGRKKWVEAKGYQFKAFIPYTFISTSRGHPLHQVGFLYTKNGIDFEERSLYLDLNGEILHFKFLGPKLKNQWKDFLSIVDQMTFRILEKKP